MSDYGLFLVEGMIDMAFVDGDIAADDGLQTAVLISLFADARATEDMIPSIDRDGDLRGWWADAFNDDAGDQTGSQLWTIQRAKQLQRTLADARDYARNSLRWLTEDRVADRVEVFTSYPQRGWMLLEVHIYRPGSSNPVVFRFNYEWNAQLLKVVT